MTGGANYVLSSAGVSAGKSVFTAAGHDRLNPYLVEFYTTNPVPVNGEPGVARAGIKISRSVRETEEGCCNVKAGAYIVDIGFRWNLNQSVTDADDVYDLLKALLFNTAAQQVWRSGVLPS